MFTNKEKNSETKDYLEILTKMLELEKQKKKINPLKITICIVGGIGCVMFIGILCYSIVKSEFSLDSILSTLLAFFSIFISIFFYFKADETSTNFYNSSYEFMKDISVTLGKIEERFGEKLNSLNDKISHLDRISNETSEEIEGKKDDKDSIINDLMDKANLNEEEKDKYRKELAEKEAEIEMLRNHKYLAEREARKLRNQIVRIQNEQDDFPLPPKDMLEDLLRTHDTSDITSLGMRRLQKLGIIDADGRINEHSIIRLMDTYYS
jgi:Uncharacterized conserved protein